MFEKTSLCIIDIHTTKKAIKPPPIQPQLREKQYNLLTYNNYKGNLWKEETFSKKQLL